MLDSSMFGSLMKGAATVATPEQTPLGEDSWHSGSREEKKQSGESILGKNES